MSKCMIEIALDFKSIGRQSHAGARLSPLIAISEQKIALTLGALQALL